MSVSCVFDHSADLLDPDDLRGLATAKKVPGHGVDYAISRHARQCKNGIRHNFFPRACESQWPKTEDMTPLTELAGEDREEALRQQLDHLLLHARTFESGDVSTDLYATLTRILRGYLIKHHTHECNADDEKLDGAISDVICRIFEGNVGYDPSKVKHPIFFIIKMAVNALRDMNRKRNVIERTQQNFSSVSSKSSDGTNVDQLDFQHYRSHSKKAQEQAFLDDVRAIIEEVLAAEDLTVVEIDAFTLWLQGYKAGWIAEDLGIPVQDVYIMTRKVKRRMLTALTEAGFHSKSP